MDKGNWNITGFSLGFQFLDYVCQNSCNNFITGFNPWVPDGADKICDKPYHSRVVSTLLKAKVKIDKSFSLVSDGSIASIFRRIHLTAGWLAGQ